MFIRSLKHERASVGEDRGVEASGDLRRDAHTSFPCQFMNEFPSRACGRVDPIYVGEWTATNMMINADEKLRPLFGKDQVSMFDLAKILSKHLS